MQTFTFYASDDKLKNRGNTASEKIGVRTSQIALLGTTVKLLLIEKDLPLYFRANVFSGTFEKVVFMIVCLSHKLSFVLVTQSCLT